MTIPYIQLQLEIYSRCYNGQPLVIQGAGAGNDTTAAGVLADIIDIQDLFPWTVIFCNIYIYIYIFLRNRNIIHSIQWRFWSLLGIWKERTLQKLMSMLQCFGFALCLFSFFLLLIFRYLRYAKIVDQPFFVSSVFLWSTQYNQKFLGP